MGDSQDWTLAIQYRSRRSAFSAATVQAISDMIYILFLLAWYVVFGKQNYLLTLTTYKNWTRPISISENGIVVNVTPGTLDMVHGSTQTKNSPLSGFPHN